MKLVQGLQRLNFPQEEIDRLVHLMESYINELVLFNSAYNLVNASDRDQIVVRHILDSLAAAQIIADIAKKISNSARQQNASKSNSRGDITIADIGSGGGLPGIPLAAALPQFNFILIERMAKRCAFLQNAAAILGLKNVMVQNQELEKTTAASIDIATFRAFRPLDKQMLKSLLAVLKDGGVLAAYKARRSKIEEEMSALGYSKAEASDFCSACGDSFGSRAVFDSEKDSLLYKIIPLEVPFLTDVGDKEDRERNLVLIRAKGAMF